MARDSVLENLNEAIKMHKRQTQNMQKSVLVVDDEKDIIEMLSYNLEREGYRVLAARDGKGALVFSPERVSELCCERLTTDRGTQSNQFETR